MKKIFYKVENDVIVDAIVGDETYTNDDYIEIEENPSIGNVYDSDLGWVEPIVEIVKQVRGQRKALLENEVDRMVMNTLRWNSLTPEKQQEWTDYRQALLDITDQIGYPRNVIWPTRPGAE